MFCNSHFCCVYYERESLFGCLSRQAYYFVITKHRFTRSNERRTTYISNYLVWKQINPDCDCLNCIKDSEIIQHRAYIMSLEDKNLYTKYHTLLNFISLILLHWILNFSFNLFYLFACLFLKLHCLLYFLYFNTF